jgi:phosphoglycolate phosphatase
MPTNRTDVGQPILAAAGFQPALSEREDSPTRRTPDTILRHVIFDLDGTLVDSLPGIQWSVEVALAACGIPAACPDLKPLIGPPIRVILATVTGLREPAALDRLEQAFRASYDSAGWRKTTCQPGTLPMIEHLHSAGHHLSVVTNKPGKASRRILRELAIDTFFREIVSRDSRAPAFGSKAEMLTEVICRETDGAVSMMVGDTLEDCQAAFEAGIACAIVPHGYGSGLGKGLPPGCRLIAGWGDLVEWCEAPAYQTGDCQ